MDDIRRSHRGAASGKFLLRLDPALHERLRSAAAALGLSLNDYCARRLAAPLNDATLAAPFAEAVGRAADLFGEALLGVVLFGSLARAEQRADSDVDLLVVLEPSVPLTRALYRPWDERPLTWSGRRVEPHLVRLPGSGSRLTPFWAEIALDALVLFERGLAISRRLAAMRRELLAGRLERRTTHGRPYWAEVA